MTKYGAKPTTVDGIRFASMKEAKRYGELKLLEKAGEIRNLELQPTFPIYAVGTIPAEGGLLPANWTLTKIGHYAADFAYVVVHEGAPGWSRVVEDVKGFKTPLYKWKKKHVEAQYGITVVEI